MSQSWNPISFKNKRVVDFYNCIIVFEIEGTETKNCICHSYVTPEFQSLWG